MGRRHSILIVGSTPLAAWLAARLLEEGHSVHMLDRAPADASAPSPEGLAPSARVEGEPLEEASLRRAQAHAADCMIGATASDDLNLASALVCHEHFHVGRTIAVVQNPQKADVFAKLGIEVVCTTLLAGSSILRSLDVQA
jgi:Trk K+ transport system NAD-binding subunit